MVLRRMLFQVGILAGCVAFIVTLWLTLSGHNFDILQACFRAIGAGVATVSFSLLISGLIIKLGDQVDSQP